MKAEDIKTIAIIGAGDMGHGIAEVCALAGLKVNLYDIKQEFVDKGMNKIKESLGKQVAKQKMTAENCSRIINSITGFTVLRDALKDVDYMIEAVPEIMELKLKIFKEADEAAPKHAILASNTSTMSITQMAAATNRPDKVLGIHFFNPPVMMFLVEVIRGEKTSAETMNVSYDLFKNMKNFRGPMVPVRVEKDVPGFIFNRVNAPVMLFIMEMYEKGLVNPEAVDAKIRSVGSPMGPYETMDFSGLDVAYHGMKYFAKTLSPEFEPSGWLVKSITDGNLGKKTGKGIFNWPAGARPVIDMSKADPSFDPLDIVCLQVNEGTKLIQEGVTDKAAEIDKAIINGSGSPFGPFALAKGMGWPKVAERCEAISKKLGIKWFLPTDMLKKGDIQI